MRRTSLRREVTPAGLILLVAFGTGFQLLYGQGRALPQGITGVVTDPSGAVVPDAKVVVQNIATGVETGGITTKAGFFSFPGLLNGTYRVSVSAAGFKTAVRDNITVLSGQTPNLEIQLPVGATAEQVTVTAQTPVLDTTSMTMGTTRTREEWRDQPLPASPTIGQRDAVYYFQVMGGVNPVRGNSIAPLVEGVGDGGGFASITTVKMDGVYATPHMGQGPLDSQRPVPEVYQEVRMVSNGNAQYGFDLGSSYELVLKSGTNRFHGTAYGYLQNDALNSRNFFAPKRTVTKQPDYGVVFGGPIKKNKHFFFGAWNAYRRRIATSALLLSVPTAKMRNGDLSEFLGPQVGTDLLGRPVFSGEIYDPATTRPEGKGGFIRDPFMFNGQLNAIDPGRFSKISTYYLNAYPLPNLPGVASNWTGNALPFNRNKDMIVVKTDHDFGAHRLSLGWHELIRDRTVGCAAMNGPTTAIQGWGADINSCGTSYQRTHRPWIGYTWTPRPNLILDAKGGLTLAGSSRVPNDVVLNNGAKAGLTGVYRPGLPVVTISDEQGYGFVTGVTYEMNVVVPANVDLTWIKSAHQLKFGAARLQTGQVFKDSQYPNGGFNFVRLETALPDFTGVQAGRPLGSGLASYLLGQVDNAVVQSPVAQRYQGVAWGFYAQDQWRVTSKLTLDYGLRWDMFFPPYEQYDRNGTFDPNRPNPGAGGRLGALTFWGSGPGRNGRHYEVEPNYGAFGPRLGIAYQFLPKMVMRAFYGIYHWPTSGILFQGRWMPNTGWGAILTRASTDNGVTAAFANWDNGTFTLPVLPKLDPTLLNNSGVVYVDRNSKGLVHSMGFSIERELPHGILFRVRYGGKLSHGVPTNDLQDLNALPLKYLSLGQLLSTNINSPQARAAGIAVPYPGFNGSVAQALRPYPQYLNIANILSFEKTELWHAGIFELQKHWGGGLTFLVNYMISKQLSNDPLASSNAGISTPYTNAVQTSELRNRTGKANIVSSTSNGGDRPQILNLTYTYELPFGRGKRFLGTASPVVNHLVGGWTISGIQSYTSGTVMGIRTSASIPSYGPIWALRNPAGGAIRSNVGCTNYDPNAASRNQYLNPNGFVAPAQFSLGDTFVLPNTRTCGYLNEDFSLVKRFYWRERYQVKIGIDLLNAFNRHMWTGLQTNVSNPATYGHYTSASDPRIMEAHINIDF